MFGRCERLSFVVQSNCSRHHALGQLTRRSCGVEGVRVDRAGDIGDAVRNAIAANKPYLIDVDIGADVNPAGAGVWELPGLGQSKVGIGSRYQPA